MIRFFCCFIRKNKSVSNCSDYTVEDEEIHEDSGNNINVTVCEEQEVISNVK